MAALLLSPEIGTNLTLEQRIKLVMDLARRVELLDDLLRATRENRCAFDDVRQTEIDAMLVL